jgi:hypothetical protein
MSNKRMDGKGEFRNEPVRVAEAEIENAESLPAIPTTIIDVVEAIENGTIPDGEILQKIREVDCSGNSCRWIKAGSAMFNVVNARYFPHINDLKDGYFYRFPQDKISGIFKSDRLPSWWKCKKLAGNDDSNSNRDVCASFIPTFADFEPWAEGLDDLEYAFLKTVIGYEDQEERLRNDEQCRCEIDGLIFRVSDGQGDLQHDLEVMLSRHPNLAKTAHDRFGNNALHYCWTRWIESDGDCGFQYGEHASAEEELAKFLIEHGCDPNEPNDFGVRYCDLRIA